MAELITSAAQNDLTNAWWTNIRAANSTTVNLVADTNNNTHGVSRGSIAAGYYRFQAELKAGAEDWVELVTFNGVDSWVGSTFNVNTGVKGTDTGATGSIISLGSGWYRCTSLFKTSFSGTIYIHAAEADGDSSFAGDDAATTIQVRAMSFFEILGGGPGQMGLQLQLN